MESVLILSATEKGIQLFSNLLGGTAIYQITLCRSCGDARRLLGEKDFDLVIINAPLGDESGEALACHIAQRAMAQVLLVVKSEFYEAVSAACEEYGVLTVSKPIHKAVFWSALSLARSTRNRLRRMQAENTQLKQRIEDIRIIDRAKCILISHMGMGEQDAHRYIEKQAMDMRTTKRSIAEGILKTYEN